MRELIESLVYPVDLSCFVACRIAAKHFYCAYNAAIIAKSHSSPSIFHVVKWFLAIVERFSGGVPEKAIELNSIFRSEIPQGLLLDWALLGICGEVTCAVGSQGCGAPFVLIDSEVCGPFVQCQGSSE